jgi:hypothetical protein
MSLTAENESPKFMPFDTIVKNGLKRMLDFIKSNKFTFIVNGFHFESTVAETILISPFVYESLLQDPSVSTFCISSSKIDSNDFVEFVELFCLNNSFDSTIPVLSLLSIFRALSNESLSISLLALMHSQLGESQCSFNSRSDQSGIPLWSESQATFSDSIRRYSRP